MNDQDWYRRAGHYARSQQFIKFGLVVLAGAVGSVLTPAVQGNSQSLDEAVRAQLDNSCEILVDGSPREPDGEGPLTQAPIDFGPNLQTICAFPTATGAATAGGGAGLSQSTATSPIIARRLRRLRLEEEEKQEEKTTAIQGASPDAVMKLTDRLSVFASIEYENLSRDVTPNEDGFNSDKISVTGGGDYRVTKNVLLGLALNYRRLAGDHDSGGDFTNQNYGGLLFANFIPAPGFFIDATFGGSFRDLENSRNVSFFASRGGSGPDVDVSGTVSSDAIGSEFEGQITGGYDHTIGRFTVGPRVGFSWVRTNTRSFTETGDTGLELHFADQRRTSVQSAVGLFGTAAFSTSMGVVIPQIGFDYIHEFKDDRRNIEVSFAQDGRSTPTTFTFQNEAPDRNFFDINAGLSMVLPNGITPFLNYRGLLGHRYFSSHAVTGGARWEF